MPTNFTTLPEQRAGGIVQPVHVREAHTAINSAETLLESSGISAGTLAIPRRRVVTTTTDPTLDLTTTFPNYSGGVIKLGRAAGTAVTLPNPTGQTVPLLGSWIDFLFSVNISGGSTVFTLPGGQFYGGGVFAVDTDSSNALVFDRPGAVQTMTFNGTTTGGTVESRIRISYFGTSRAQIEGINFHTGNFATVFA